MRKILLFILVLGLFVGLTGCRDKQIDDSSHSIIFYVGPKSTVVDSYLNVEHGSLIEEPEAPTKDGYLFDGWYKEIQYENLWNFETDTVTDSFVLYAKWVSAVWTLQFVLNPELNEVYTNPDDPVPTEFTLVKEVYMPVVSRPGGRFRGWILVPPEEYTLDMPIYRYTSELPYLEQTSFVLYPYFNNSKYMITFSVGSQTGVPKPAPKTGVEYGSVIDWTPKLQDTATHRFVGWFTKNGINSGDWGIQIVDGDYWTIAANALLYAKWEEI